MGVYSTEITSTKIPSDNPIHQRLLKAYYLALPYIKGDLLELGCGEGRGVELFENAKSYTAIDKIDSVIKELQAKHQDKKFIQSYFPPVGLPDNSFDSIVSFQVIEHIKDDNLFIADIFRLLKPGGTALITTPNIKMSLSRNPWHIREYTADQLSELCLKYFDEVEMMGVAGNEKVMSYHEENRKSVQRIMKFDILNLQYRLPAPILRIPYEILNRLNRNSLQKQNPNDVQDITIDDYFLKEKDERNLDLFCILSK